MYHIDLLDIPIRVRLPLVPGLNDSDENVRATAAFAASLANMEALDILPYHRIGESKWRQLDRLYKLHGVVPHTNDQLDELADIAREYGIKYPSEDEKPTYRLRRRCVLGLFTERDRSVQPLCLY